MQENKRHLNVSVKSVFGKIENDLIEILESKTFTDKDGRLKARISETVKFIFNPLKTEKPVFEIKINVQSLLSFLKFEQEKGHSILNRENLCSNWKIAYLKQASASHHVLRHPAYLLVSSKVLISNIPAQMKQNACAKGINTVKLR